MITIQTQFLELEDVIYIHHMCELVDDVIREQLKPKRAQHTPGPWAVLDEKGGE